jgi:hypothetical protein
MLGPEVVLPDRALYLPTFSHLLIVNKLLRLSARSLFLSLVHILSDTRLAKLINFITHAYQAALAGVPTVV